MSREGKSRWGFWESFIIGKQDNPMMKRLRVLQTPWFGIYVHFIYREDLDPVPHDHPWNFWRMVLKGGYLENYFVDPIEGKPVEQIQAPFWGPTGTWPNRVPVAHAHRITFVEPGTVSLVLVGKKQRIWGFWTPEDLSTRGDGYGWESRSWVDYRDALGLRPSEGVHSQDAIGDQRGTLGRDLEPVTAREIAELTEGCAPPSGCSCMGHRWAGVRHVVACCDIPHIDQMDSADVRPSAP